MDMILQLILLVLGFVMLVKGANWFVDGASSIAAKFKIPPLIIGLTIVAMGTSAPEAAVSISAALKGSADITIGNVLGSNILNILIILGISSAITALAVARSTVRLEIPFLIGISVLLVIQGQDGTVSLVDGLILIALFLAYLGYLIYTAKRNPDEDPQPPKELKLWQAIAGTLVGLVLIVAGSSVAVDAATAIARLLGLSERFIGLTIVALGTSLPELFTSASAARKGHADIAIGNIVGSNLFNILFVVGLSALIVPVPFSVDFRFDSIIAILAAGLLLLFCIRDKKLQRWNGVLLLAGYAAYFISIL